MRFQHNALGGRGFACTVDERRLLDEVMIVHMESCMWFCLHIQHLRKLVNGTLIRRYLAVVLLYVTCSNNLFVRFFILVLDVLVKVNCSL